MARQFRFVAVSNPTEAPSSESKKLAYSHAFRQAHAQRRRKQIEGHRKAAATSPSLAVGKAFVVPGEVVLAPLNHVLTSNQDPFSSLARPLSLMEYYLLDHYVHVIVPFTVGHCGLFNRPGDQKTELLRDWVGLAVADDTVMVAAVLLSTCRYILQAQPDNLVIVQLALQYKQICLEKLRQEMSNTSAPVNTLTVAKSLALVLDEVTAGEHDIARKHLNGVFGMVNSCGGVGELGLTGLMERMYRRFIEILGLQDPGTARSCSETLSKR
ncbi:hypothetical protein F5144DRAFT_565710 [Chaetomium tenue]|uniref:Uncharacterized protein n=1 Tax=Chaetomium tenue TaxID=1854479 RepID=A0ACB7PC43_9PEZI|nr:hypothetical protein F5144DRAFT_565710 [Chaetomium globosum]